MSAILEFIEAIHSKRECPTCGRTITFYGFKLKAWLNKNRIFLDLAEEIWDNPMVIFRCCNCYSFMKYNFEEDVIYVKPYS